MAEALRGEYVARRRLLLRVMPNVFAGDEEAAAVKECWESAGLSAAGGPAYRTLRLDASPPLDALRKGLDQKWRNQLNRAEKNGLTVVEGSGDDLYALFRRLYAEMYARKRFETSISVEAFGRIQEGLEPALKMQIFICKAQDEPVSALVGSALGDTGIYLLGATSDSGLQAKGAYLLQWCMLRWLKERGCRFYDLGGINPERNPGVYHFKSGLCGADVTHLGRFEASGSALSAFCVRRAEQLQNAARALRAAARP
jgi:lipid II:glycine glycyltransferase (peptidoglycan interpeptide bridge formation enzyme)